MVEVTVETPVRPTEDTEKVLAAVEKIFPEATFTVEDGWVRGHGASIATLMKKTTEERVRDAARGALWRGRLDDRSTRFELAKQAAYVGRVNFNEVTHPLGDLIVTVEVDDLQALLDDIAPPTRAEIAAMEKRAGTVAARAELHGEEQELEAIGTGIDEGLDELEAELAREEARVRGETDADDEEDTKGAGDEEE